MEERIGKIERELAIMGATLSETKRAIEEISHTMKEMLKLQTETQVLNTKMTQMDKELNESFKRVHKRTDKIEDNIRWVVRSIVASVIGAVSYVIFAH